MGIKEYILFKRATLWLTCALLLLAVSATSAQSGTLTVDVDQDLGPINPYLFGANYGPWATMHPDVWPDAEVSGVRFLLFPGGNWGEEYDMTPFMLDQYMLIADLMNIEPAVCVRMLNSTVEKAVEIFTYMNIDHDYNIRYWCIGSEPNLWDNYDEAAYNQQWREIGEALKALDPDIVLIGPNVSQYPPVAQDTQYDDLLRAFLQANGDLVDIVSVHRYPFPRTNDQIVTIDDLRANTPEWTEILTQLKATIQEETGGEMPIAVTEFNTHWSNSAGGDATPDSHYAAVWLADVLGRFIDADVQIGTYFVLYRGTGGGHGMMGRYEMNPPYYTYQLYSHFGNQHVHSESTVPDVRIYAARRDDGALTLMVINLGMEEVSTALELSGFTPSGEAEVWQLAPDVLGEQVEPVDISAGITIPGQSVTLYIVPRE
jgi:hypothetical protein